MSLDQKRLSELLYQALETETGGRQIYETAVGCAVNDDLRKEWTKYLDETKRHHKIVKGLFDVFDLDPDAETPGRAIVRGLGESLVSAMKAAKAAGDADAAEIVAGECVVLAETKDHLNWKLLSECAKSKDLDGEKHRALKEATDEVEDQEDEHLYHSNGWTRELWFKSLGLRAVVPPPEEQKHVKSAIGASRAEHQRGRMRSK